MNRPFGPASGPLLSITLGVGAVVLGAGCQLMVNPFTDELAGQGAVTTPSVEGAWAVQTTRAATHRPFAPMELTAKDGTVTHGPLYFEDGFEDLGCSEDGRFAWTGQDYGHMLYWRVRFLLNTALFPISSVVTPPWIVMASDGRPSRRVLGMDHDAERWVEN